MTTSTDSFDKGYTFDCPTTFDAIYLPRYDVANRNMFTDSRFDRDTQIVGNNEIVHDNMFALMTLLLLLNPTAHGWKYQLLQQWYLLKIPHST